MALSYVGAGTFQGGSGALSVPPPSGIAANDLMFLAVESANEAIATPAGWTEVSGSPISGGTAGAAGGIRLAVFWKWAGASEGNVSVADTGNHTTAAIVAYRGVPLTYPVHSSTAFFYNSTSSTIFFSAVAAPMTGSVYLGICAQNFDGNSTNSASVSSSSAFGRLSSITKLVDQTVNAGAGGGLVIAAGVWATSDVAADNIVASSLVDTGTRGTIVIVLTPSVPTPPPGAALVASVRAVFSVGAVDTNSGLNHVSSSELQVASDAGVVELPWINRIIILNGTNKFYSDNRGATFSTSTSGPSIKTALVCDGKLFASVSGAAYTSTDGVTWTSVGFDNLIVGGARNTFSYGKQRAYYCGVSASNIYWSADNVAWAAIPLPASVFGARIWSTDTELIVLALDNANSVYRLYVTTNDSTWTSYGSYSAADIDVYLKAFSFDGTYYRFAGTGGTKKGASLAALATDLTFNKTLQVPAWHGAYVFSIDVVSGSELAVTISLNGTTWVTEAKTFPAGSTLRLALVVGNAIWLLRSYTTTTPYDLTIHQCFGKGVVLGPTFARLAAAAVAVATLAPAALLTQTLFQARAVTEAITVQLPASTGPGLSCVTVNSDGFFALGGFNGITGVRSIDGVNWTRETLPMYDGLPISVTYYDVAALGGERLIGIATNNDLTYSPGGVSRRSDDLFDNYLSAVNLPADTVGSHKLIWTAIAASTDSAMIAAAIAYEYGYAARTDDAGATWITTSLPALSNHYWYGIAYGAGVFVAIALNQNSASPKFAVADANGAGWGVHSPISLPLAAAWQTIAYGPAGFLTAAVVPAIGGTVRIMKSADGVNWTAYDTGLIPDTANVTLTASEFEYTLTIPGEIYTSPDGLNWIQMMVAGPVGTPQRRCNAYKGGVYVLGASDSDIINVIRYAGGVAKAAASLTTTPTFGAHGYAVATAIGALSLPIALAAAVSAQASSSATGLIGVAELVVSASSEAGAQATLLTGIRLAGGIASESLANGSLTTQINLLGVALAEQAAHGDLSALVLHHLDAAAASEAQSVAGLTTAIRLAADSLAVASAQGFLGSKTLLGKSLCVVGNAPEPLCVAIEQPIIWTGI